MAVVVFIFAFISAAPATRAADLVVWWEKGQTEQEDQAVREIVAAFEQKTGKQVELVLETHERIRHDAVAATEAGWRPPDFIFDVTGIQYRDQWAYEGRLVDLTDAVGPFLELYHPSALERATLIDGTTGQRGLYALPMGFSTHHVHVWKSLLEAADFTLEDIPQEWNAFWAFWCDQVQPAVRAALGRDDIWGIGLPMSATSVDTENAFWQFVDAYGADYVTPDGELVISDPEAQRRLVEVIESYTAIYRKGCTPPDSVTWDSYENNREFLAQTIVMTPNMTLSIPNALKATRPEDYYENAATIDWPGGAHGQPLPIYTAVERAFVFKDGGHAATAKEFVSFLVGEGWLAHFLHFSGERMAPAMPKLLEAPFWLDNQLTQFQLALGSTWLAADGTLQVDRPEVRQGLIRAVDDYTAIWRKGCTPPDALNWGNIDNNRAFLEQRVVMTANVTMSIPGALRATRPDDYLTNAATIPWPRRVDGRPLVLDGGISRSVVFAGGPNPDLARAFVRFLIGDGWLAHWLTFIGDRVMPPMRKLTEQSFWLDPNDPHRMSAAMQILEQPPQNSILVRGHEQRSGQVWDENVWGKAVHRVVTEGVTPEQAVDEAIARIKEILAE